MIVGVISPFQSDIQSIHKAMDGMGNFTYVTEAEVVKYTGIGKLVNCSKEPLLQALDEAYGNILVSGDILMDESARDYILKSGGVVIVVWHLPSVEELYPEGYWEDMDVVNAAVKDRLTGIYQQNRDKGWMVCLDFEDCRDKSINLLDQTVAIIHQNATEKRDVINVSMEDIINKAMRDLGVEPIDSKAIEPAQSPKLETPRVEEAPELPAAQPAELSSDVEVDKLPNVENPPPEIPQQSSKSTYLKMKNGTMVLFIPSNYQFPAQVIGGVEYQTIVFRAPDLGNVDLQELKILNEIVAQPHPSPTIRKPVHAVDSSDLAQLVAKKVQLDQDIKSARQNSDKSLVELLRKQRRQVRRQINAIGGGKGNGTPAD